MHEESSHENKNTPKLNDGRHTLDKKMVKSEPLEAVEFTIALQDQGMELQFEAELESSVENPPIWQGTDVEDVFDTGEVKIETCSDDSLELFHGFSTSEINTNKQNLLHLESVSAGFRFNFMENHVGESHTNNHHDESEGEQPTAIEYVIDLGDMKFENEEEEDGSDCSSILPDQLEVNERKKILAKPPTESGSADLKKEDIPLQKKKKVPSKECRTCNKVFSTKTLLRKHMELQWHYRCRLCDKKFGNLFHLRKHQRAHEKDPLVCTTCNITLASFKKLVGHKRTHEPRKHRCNVCGKMFGYRAFLLSHMKIHEEFPQINDRSFAARNSSPSSILENDSVENTAKGNECIPAIPREMNNQASDPLVQETRNELHRCQTCKYDFNSKNALDRHLRSKLHADKLLALSGNRNHHAKNVTDEPKGDCSQQKSEIDDRPFKCSICPKAFKTKASQYSHIQYVHGARSYICHNCGINFTRRNTLNKHLRRKTCVLEEDSNMDGSEENNIDPTQIPTKPEDSSFPCTKCDKTLPSQWHLLFHLKFVHKKIYKCSLCDESFAVQNWLERHMRTRHTRPDDSSKSLTCVECNKVFETKSELAQHKQYHRIKMSKSCTICNKRFRTIDLRLRHEASCGKKDDQPLACEQCGKKFSSVKKKISHMKMRALKPHTCDTCCKSFSYRNGLLKHTRIHHDEYGDTEEQNVESDSDVDVDVEY